VSSRGECRVKRGCSSNRRTRRRARQFACAEARRQWGNGRIGTDELYRLTNVWRGQGEVRLGRASSRMLCFCNGAGQKWLGPQKW